MVARKPTKGKVRGNKGKAEVREGKKTEESGNEVAKMEIDESVKVAKKDKLHKIAKRKNIRHNGRGKKNKNLKLQLLNVLENDVGVKKIKKGKGITANSIVKTQANFVKEKNKKNLKELLNETYNWEIMYTGIPPGWKGNIEELTNEYKQFNLQAFSLKRENWNRQWCKVLHLYFETEEEMKKAVSSGPKNEVLGIPLSLRMNPIRMLYISSIPFDINEKEAYSELKKALGSGVYEITFPRNKEKKLLGHAIAYVIDEASHKELLDGRTLNLWKLKQSCCTKEDFFKRFVLNVVSGWLGHLEVLNSLVNTLEASDIQVSVDLITKKLYFLDESCVKNVLKMSGLLVEGRKMIFSQSHSVRFVMKCITRRTKKSELLELLKDIRAFNLNYNEDRCKATFEVPAEEVEKCKKLHLTEFAGRNLEVYESGSEEMKLSKEKSRKKLQEYVIKNDVRFPKGHRLHAVAKFYRKCSKIGKGEGKGSKIGIGKSKGLKIEKGKFKGSKIEKGKVKGSKIEKRKVKGSKIEKGKVKGSKIEKGKVKGSNIEKGKVKGSKIEKGKGKGSKIEKGKGKGSRIEEGKGKGSRIQKEIGKGSKIGKRKGEGSKISEGKGQLKGRKGKKIK